MKISLKSRLLRRLMPWARRLKMPGGGMRRSAATTILAGGLAFVGTAAPVAAVELMQNGGFEMNDGFDGDNIGFGWDNPDGPPVFDVYSHSTQVYYEGPAPADAGDWYFHTVGVTNSEGVSQNIQLTPTFSPAELDSGTLKLDFSAWLSGYTAQNDHPDVRLDFFDAADNALPGGVFFDGADFGPGSFFDTTVTGADPSTFANPIAAWKRYEAIQGVAVGARTARVTVLQDSLTGNGNDNYTDLISLDVEDSGVPQWLKLRVNTTNGLTSIVNATEDDVAINFYEIRSESGSLSADSWNSFDDQNLDAIGDGPGQSWDEGGGANSELLTEAYLLGTSMFGSGGDSESLGSAYNSALETQDLQFFYAGVDNVLARGIVEYIAGISGDFNGDGDYDCLDVNSLTGEIAAGTNDAAFDLTGDGLVDIDDLNAWLVEGGANNPDATGGNPFLVGDANLDGSVDVSDFNLWNGNKFTSVAEWCAGDFNADGAVDVSDFNAWNGNKFNSAGGAVTVPEPAAWTVLMMACGTFCVASPRRRLS